MSQGPEFEARMLPGDDAKSTRSSRSAVSTRTAISVTLPTTSGTDGEKAKVDIQNAGTGPSNASPSEEQREVTFSPGGPMAPVGTPTQAEAKKQQPIPTKVPTKVETESVGIPKEGQARLRRMVAVACIERTWLAYRDRQMFRLLKHAVCAAENSLSYEILRKVAPKEAEFLRDKFLQTKVRFRFGGTEFPPLIYFKIYMCSSSAGMALKYISGKKMIQPASEAARDACDLMGARKFYDQVIEDTLQCQTHPVSDEVDVTTLKDYMQYLSLLDELPSYMGGKENHWRQLTLEVLPRQTIFYDVVEYLYSNKMSTRLQEELPALLVAPLTQEVQREHIRIISELRALPFIAPPKLRPVSGNKPMTGRRSKQAQQRVSRMRRMYEKQREVEEGEPFDEEQMYYNADKLPADGGRISAMMRDPGPAYTADHHQGAGLGEEEDEDWEREANRLYEWTQELSLDELVATPRLSTANTGRVMVG